MLPVRQDPAPMGPQVGHLVLRAAIIARSAIPFAPETLRAVAVNIISAMVVLSPSNQRGEAGPVLLPELARSSRKAGARPIARRGSPGSHERAQRGRRVGDTAIERSGPCWGRKSGAALPRLCRRLWRRQHQVMGFAANVGESRRRSTRLECAPGTQPPRG